MWDPSVPPVSKGIEGLQVPQVRSALSAARVLKGPPVPLDPKVCPVT